MEEKRRDVGTLPAAISSAVTTRRSAETPPPEPTSSRRRGSGLKRKANNNNSSSSNAYAYAYASGSSSTPSKRLAREKPPVPQAPSIHNGPCTRARQTPNNLNLASFDVGETGLGGGGSQGVSEILNRSQGVVVELTKPSPDDSVGDVAVVGKEGKGASVDWEALESAVDAEFEAVISRDCNAHAVPIPCGWFSWTKIHPLEENTLPTFFNGKSDSRTSDMYTEIRNWIMKKYHADPNTHIEVKDLSELSVGDLDAKQEVMEFLDHWGLINFHPFPLAGPSVAEPADNGAKNMDFSLDELYRFDSVQPFMPVVPKACAVTPAAPSGWIPESATAEELVRPDGPSVEYHCNSCSADCSRKRYHCQKQADFDLCTECYNNGKFDSNMAPSDFILMEPAEVPGLSSGKWTDQETLLLLEALELFNENWNEIAEHVATKTKAQCILHFVQMPIEDTFLDCNDEVDANVQEIADPDTTNNDSSAPKEALETTESKTSACEDQPSSSPMDISKPEDTGEVKAGQKTLNKEANENCALKALKDAFEAVGSLPVDGGHFSFADAGNPVMALAAFLVQLVEPDLATASAHHSLKSLSGNAPGMHLAIRHCFLLEDPPDDKKELTSSERTVDEMIDQDAQKDENQDSVLEVNNSSTHDNDKAVKDYVPEEKDPDGECTDKPPEKEPYSVATHEKARPSHQSDFLEDRPPSSVKESDDIITKSEPPENPAKVSVDLKSKSEPAASIVKESGDKGSVKVAPQYGANSANEPTQCGEAPKELDILSGPLASEKKVPLQQVTSNLVVENGANSEAKDDHNIDKLKHAAITALSAAAAKAQLLANLEEEQVRQLAASLIEKQLYKLELKLAFFSEMESVIARARDILDRSRQKLYHERAQIIAARFGYPASGSKAMPQSLPTNRIAMNYANSILRPPFSMASQRPSIARPIMTSTFPPSNPFASPAVGASLIRPSGQDKVSSIGMK